MSFWRQYHLIVVWYVFFVLGCSIEETSLNTFQTTYRKEQSGEAYAVVSFLDGGYGVAGVLDSANTRKAFFAKFSVSGLVEWDKTLFAGERSSCFDVLLTSTNEIVLTGEVETTPSNNDIFVLKLSESGESIWVKRWDSTSSDKGISVKEAGDGILHVLGLVDNNKIVILKIDEQGNQIGINRTSLVGHNRIRSLIPSTNGAGLVIAESGEWLTINHYQNSGSEIFYRNYRRLAEAYDAVEIAQGQYVFTGSSSNGLYISKFNTNNNSEQTSLFGISDGIGRHIYKFDGNKVGLLGSSQNSILWFELNESFKTDFIRYYGSNGYITEANRLSKLNNGDVVISGKIRKVNSTSGSVLIIKTNRK